MRKFSKAWGCTDEALGAATNAESGVAIQSRQIANVRNHVDAFETLRLMKKREGRMLLGLMQALSVPNIVQEVIDDKGMAQSVTLNETVPGQDGYRNDIRTTEYDIYVVESGDYEAPAEEQAKNMGFLLQNPNLLPILADEEILRTLGFRNAKGLAERFQKRLQGVQGAPQQSEAPPTPLAGGGQVQ